MTQVATSKPDPIGDLFATGRVSPKPPAPSPSAASNVGWVLVALAIVGFYAYKHNMLPSFIPLEQNLFGESGLHVLVVYESQNGMPQALNGEVRDYLDSHCAVDAGKHPQRLFVDQNAKFAPDAAKWQKAMQRGQKQLPWIVIGSDKGNYEGPLPGTPSAVIDLVKRYGGP